MKKILTPLKYLLFLAIGAGLLWLTVKDLPFSTVLAEIRKADLFWLLFSILLSLLALLSRTFRWIQLIEPLGYKPRYYSTYNATMFGYLANLAIPRLGEITRCGALGKSEEIPFDKLVGTVIVERVSDVIMLLISMLVVAIIEFDRLGGFLQEKLITPALEKLTNSPLIIIALIAFFAAGTLGVVYLFKMKNPPEIVNKIRSLLHGVYEGLISVTRLKNKWVFVFHSFFIWVMYWLMTYVCFFALPATSTLGLSAGLFIMMLGSVGMTAPVQGGLGAYELLVVAGLFLYNIDNTNGLAFALMVHGTQTVLMLVLGLVSMISLFFLTKPRSSRIHESSENTTK